MAPMAAALSDPDIEDLAAFYGAQSGKQEFIDKFNSRPG
ncbi:MAG: cytochrome c [Gammaproteobacteria bacterium]